MCLLATLAFSCALQYLSAPPPPRSLPLSFGHTRADYAYTQRETHKPSLLYYSLAGAYLVFLFLSGLEQRYYAYYSYCTAAHITTTRERPIEVSSCGLPLRCTTISCTPIETPYTHAHIRGSQAHLRMEPHSSPAAPPPPPLPLPHVVYDALSKAQKAAPRLKPIPAFEVYKVAREEELAAYRMLCRVLVMHHGTPLPKAQQRILDDMGEELFIGQERQELEKEMAEQDKVLQGIRKSGVLQRRGDFTDGVEEMTVEDYLAEAPKDDGNGLYMPISKTPRVDRTDSGAARTTAVAAAAAVGAKRKGHVHAAVSKLAKEIEASGKSLLFTSSAQEEQQLIQALQQKREALMTLRGELTEA
ncbi:hypothetical protein LPMP_240500 [Leishmania panamensis]|nr:hypothetical protein LPMP_240500 [Leishmania panamensis]AIN98684.1 hypothetical protein LPMP_240500 [Leishmania panamensis]